ncbi:hypothetical protein G9C98_002216 [Cotesia typhae]|uniref:Ubiquitin carboxyl-terminal hydrolase n=1 Tax=Cotesia typhae TaxID=2053667 RepID=A0A8J5R8J3_9HYME|nr:hypothetical protein G9C98_002216 [Cotesia typhae]
MPAVSVCEPVAAALRHSLEVGQSKSSTEDITISLTSGASRILQSEVQYEETDGYKSIVLDQLKAKYIVLNLPNSNINNHQSDNNTGSNTARKKNEQINKMTRPSLPEPKTTLYQPEKVTLGWDKSFPVGSGLINVGNTCYLNSTLQALFHVPALVNWLLTDSHHNSKCEQNGQQEDAHEFLRYLLEGMERAYLQRHKATKLDSYSKETTPINQIFGGYIRTEVKCLKCQHVSTTFQHFQDLLVDIRKANTLDEALSSYFSREELDNNDYKCEACKKRVPATKQFSLEQPPKVLCVQLKRFSVLGNKISRHIGFKQTVNMGPYLWREPGEPPRKLNYKLMSIITHMGPSVGCGHYTAVAQVSSGQYYSFDDSCVRSINISNVFNTNAYIMIFEMESPAINNQLPQSVKSNGLSNLATFSNSCSLKSSSPKPSTSGLAASANGLVKSNAASSISGWEVSKDAPSPTSGATPNGWSVTDNNKEENKKSNHTSNNNSTPSAAAPRNFNGTNRSDTVSHLYKMSHRGYGSSSVTTWNGSRTQMDREVDNERREERKRHFNADDEEMDRGRTKKVKSHREYESRSNPGYNPFQEYHNGKSWNRSNGSGNYRRYYNNNSSYNRQGHGNYRHRYHNNHRDHYHRR